MAQSLLASLPELSLTHTDCGDAGLAALAATLAHTRISDLSICSNDQISVEGFRSLAAALKDLRHLEALYANDCSGPDSAAAAALAEGTRQIPLPPCSLHELNLDRCSIRDEGAQAIARVLRTGCLPYLRELEICENPIGEAGRFALVAAEQTVAPEQELVITLDD